MRKIYIIKKCSGRESNPYGHFCPQDFKSGVYTNFTTRARYLKKTRQPFLLLSGLCAQDKSRTCTPFLALPPQSSVSTIPPPGHIKKGMTKNFNSERKTGLGPATPTLARLCSTN